MTDNFELLKKYVSLPDDNKHGNNDKYYVVEIMRRGKDNPDLPAANYHFKNYYIYSMKDFNTFESEIKTICDELRMRAYFSVNHKSIKQVMLDTLAETARRVAVHDYKRPYAIFESCSGTYVSASDKKYVIDLDDIKDNANKYGLTVDEYLDKVKEIVNSCMNRKRMVEGEEGKYDNYILTVPTRTGSHIVTYGFNREEFVKKFRQTFPETDFIKEDIKENHLTLLYENLK